MPSILITGATGKQGGAVIKALTDHNARNPSNIFNLLALTRNSSSKSARTLSQLPHLETVQGDLEDAGSVEAVFKEAGGTIYGVFSVQDALGNEVQQGVNLADIASRYGVKCFVYSSVDQSGDFKPNPIPRFETKRQIEEHIRTLAPPISWTILRPAGFPELFNMPTFADMLLAVLDPSVPWKTIAVSDIGKVAAEILTAADDNKFSGQVIELTGDDKTVGEIVKILEEEKGEKHQGNAAVQVPDVLRKTFELKAKYPYVGTPERTKQWFPFVKTFRDWVRTEYKGLPV